jgi:hypothetical protein
MEQQLQWLIRKAKPITLAEREQLPDDVPPPGDTYEVLGPFFTDQIRTMVKGNMLDANDELCPENGYWFALHETEELKRLLGVEGVAVSAVASDLESTDPDLDVTLPIVPAANAATTESRPSVVGKNDEPQTTVIKRPPQPPSVEELKSRFERVNVAKSLGYYGQSASNQVLGVEKGRIWTVIFFIGVGVALIGVIWVIRSIRGA